ncbi:hypothetical protein FNV43_RR15043 [Rhamnella rubrinervis]|uniref:Zinc knuckle CX2CX4HX4C domain-containing protein n=1 Tax=Rhamnella rubrinervis TaxID=2594499 RepID=A0A8K0GTV2_9ROSA|nr:hypothetical protein FNV43_RR15043 [Rhamnella rubrinervis]
MPSSPTVVGNTGIRGSLVEPFLVMKSPPRSCQASYSCPLVCLLAPPRETSSHRPNCTPPPFQREDARSVFVLLVSSQIWFVRPVIVVLVIRHRDRLQLTAGHHTSSCHRCFTAFNRNRPKIDCEHPVAKTNKGVSNTANFTQGTLPKQSFVPSFAAMVSGFVPKTLLLETEDSCTEVQLHFEYFSEFCNNCHNLGHSVGRCNMMNRRAPQVAKPSEKGQGETKQATQRHKPPNSITHKDSVPSMVDSGVADSDSETDHADKDNTKGKSVQTVSSYIGVVHNDTVLNDTFDDLDDELPVHEDGVLQDPSDMQVLDRDGYTSRDQINMDTNMVLYDPTKAFSAAQQNLDLVASDHSVSETKDPNVWTIVKKKPGRVSGKLLCFTMLVFASRSLEDARILLSEEQIIYVDIMKVGGRQAVIGDFNAILGANERFGGGPPIHSSCTDFQAAVEAAGLLPIDTHGAFFTWGRRGTRSQVPLRSSSAAAESFKAWQCEACSSGLEQDIFCDIHEKITLAQEKLLSVQNIIGTEGFTEERLAEEATAVTL